MAYIAIPSGLTPGRFESHQNGFAYRNAGTLTGSTYKYSWVIRAPKADAIDRVRINLGAIAKGLTTALKVSIQGVDAATGSPDGAIAAYRVIPNGDMVANTMVATGLLTSDGTDTGIKKTTAVSEWIAIVVEYETFETGDSTAINSIGTNVRINPAFFDFIKHFNGTSWTADTQSIPILGLEYATAPVNPAIPGIAAWSGFGTQTYNSSSSPNVYGVQFQFPVKCKIGFAYSFFDMDSDATVELYTAAGVTTVATLDKDIQAHSIAQSSPLRLDTEVEIEAETVYVLALKPSTAANVGLVYMDVPAAGSLDQYGPGRNFVWVSATNPATTADFTALTTRQPMLVPVITQIDIPEGGGSGAVVRPIGYR